MDFLLNQEQLALKETVRNFVQREVQPLINRRTGSASLLREMMSKLKDRGFLTRLISVKDCNRSYTNFEQVLVLEELAKIEALLGRNFFLHNSPFAMKNRRLGMAGFYLGIASGILESCRRNIEENYQHDLPVFPYNSVQSALAKNLIDLEAARLLTYRAALLEDKGKGIFIESVRAEKLASELAARTFSLASQFSDRNIIHKVVSLKELIP